MKMKNRFSVPRKDGFTLLALFLQGKEMIGSFASEAARPTIFLPEQIEVLAHVSFQGYWLAVPFGSWAVKRLLKKEVCTLRKVAEVWAKGKPITGYFLKR